MNGSSHNIRLNYLYRDGGNYKQYHSEVFANVQALTLESIEAQIREQLIDGAWFYNHIWDLKDLHYYQWDNEIDHTWHEFDSIESTNDEPTKGDIQDFLLLISSKDKYSIS